MKRRLITDRRPGGEIECLANQRLLCINGTIYLFVLVDESEEHSITQVARVIADAMKFKQEFLVALQLTFLFASFIFCYFIQYEIVLVTSYQSL